MRILETVIDLPSYLLPLESEINGKINKFRDIECQVICNGFYFIIW